MKKLMLIAGFSALGLVACNTKEDASSRIQDNAQTESTTEEVASTATQTGFPVISFNETTHDFGDLKKGTSATVEFEITNEGDVDLVIINASATCGCTVPEKPEAPIKPGETAKMKVVFSASALGLQSKNVTLTTNTEAGSEMLTVRANVIE